jgi:hypothetical protein
LRLAGTEGNLSPLLYHGSTVGRPNISPRGSGDPEPELELSPLSSEPLGAAAHQQWKDLPHRKKVPPRPLVDLLEEEAIDGEQGREEEEKEKEKEEEKAGSLFVSEYVSAFEKISNG